MANNPDSPVTPGPIFEMQLVYRRTAALKAVIDLDVFGALSFDLRFTFTIYESESERCAELALTFSEVSPGRPFGGLTVV